METLNKMLGLKNFRFFRKQAGGTWYKIRNGWTKSPFWVEGGSANSNILAKETFSVGNKELIKALSGDNVSCPICEQQFITFLPFGRVKRSNAQCPVCDSLERHRLQFLFLKNETNFLTKGGKVLHVAPEMPIYTRFKQLPQLEYIAIDKFMEGYGYASDVKDMDIMALQFPDNTFDLIICNHVLEHIPDDAGAMKEIFRVLKPGGTAMLQVPLDRNLAVTHEDLSITDPQERIKHFGQFDHVRQYGRDYKDRLEKAGFTVDVRDYAQQLGENSVFTYGLMAGEDVYHCQKRG